jgi:hypothetical protein
MSRQCEHCFKRILTRKGAYAKHIRHCSSKQQASPIRTSNAQLNPLLLIHCNDEVLSDREYNGNWYNDSYDDIDNKSEEYVTMMKVAVATGMMLC